MSRKETQQRLLDAAEVLFAQKGYRNTSLRNITTKAKANIASINYHFGSKEALIVAVIKRRILPLNELRMRRLEEAVALAESENRPPLAREILAAFIEPTMRFRNSGAGARSFIILVSRALGDPDPTVRGLFIDQVRPVLQFFGQCLSRALPHLTEQEVFWRTHFMMGSLAHIMHGLNKEQMFPEELLPEDPQALVEMLLDFLSAGMEAGT